MQYIMNRAVGGMEEHVVLLGRHLDRSRFEVFSVCPDYPEVASFRVALEAASDDLAALACDYQHLGGFWKLVRQMRAWRVDVVHMHSGWWRGNILAYLAAKLAGAKAVVITEHQAPDAPEPFLPRVIRNLFSGLLVDATVSVSVKNVTQRAKYLSLPASRGHVVDNGVDVDDFVPIPSAAIAEVRERHAIPTDAIILGSLVRFEPEKGLNYLLDAMPQILAACPRAHLFLVGDGSLRQELDEQAVRLGVREQVTFAGFQTAPRPYLAAIDVFVLPVPYGSMSIALLEAMAMRKAVVMTFGGEGEAVVHGETGYCAEPRNPASIAEYVIRLLQDDALRLGMGERARRHIEDHFSAATTARKLERIYERVTGRGS
jgi:glycogen synthase